jgi:hypothetical protein
MPLRDFVMTDSDPIPAIYLTVLPGPDRKRSRSLYSYRVVYRHPREDEAGCAAAWEVVGGRMAYQVALERDEAGRHHWHCTCADAVYRAEDEGRVCKHVQGLLAFSLPLPAPQFQRRSA